MKHVKTHTIIAFVVLLGALLGLMLAIPPTRSSFVVLVWFLLTGFLMYFGLSLVSSALRLGWSQVRVGIYSVGILVLVGLSTLGQLTVLDVVTVLALAGLAQLAYQLRTKGQ